MALRKNMENHFLEVYQDQTRTFDQTAPEWRCIQLLCQKDGDGLSELFNVACSYQTLQPELYDPQGNAVGLSQIKRLGETWLAGFHCTQVTDIFPICQTLTAKRNACEAVVRMNDGNEYQDVPLCIVADTAPGGRLVSARLYYSTFFVPGLAHTRAPIFAQGLDGNGNPALVYDVVRQYFDRLHSLDVEGVMKCFDKSICFNGYRPVLVSPPAITWETVQQRYKDMFVRTIRDNDICWHTAIDDGKTCYVEFNIVPKDRHNEKITSGMAAYERSAETGLIKCVRICDEEYTSQPKF